MKRHTQAILYHLLPVVFWLLAIGGSLIPIILPLNTKLSTFNYYSGYGVALVALICIFIISRIKRHTSSVEECFQVALLLGIASYWLPTTVFLILPVWGYLIAQNLFSVRSFVASLIGFAAVTIWSAVFVIMGWIDNSWAEFFSSEKAWGWIPLGAILLAWLATKITHNTFRSRNVF